MAVKIELDAAVPDGIGRCELVDGREVAIRLDNQAPPPGTIKVRLSRKDWTEFLVATRDATP